MMLWFYWLQSLSMLPLASVAGMLSTSSDPAPVGSLQGDLE